MPHTNGLVEFQASFLEKLKNSTEQTQDKKSISAESLSNQFLGVLIGGQRVAIPLLSIKEIVQPPENFLNLSEWSKKEVCGALRYAEDLWVIFKNLLSGESDLADSENTSNESPWEKKIVLLKSELTLGNFGLLIDKSLGLFKDIDNETNSSSAVRTVKHNGVEWSVLNVRSWAQSPQIYRLLTDLSQPSSTN